MNVKKFISLLIYAVFMAAMVAVAYVLKEIELSLIVRTLIGAGVFIVTSFVAFIGNENTAISTVALILIAASWGTMASALFVEEGTPEITYVAGVCGAYLGWLFIYCLLANFSFFKSHYALCMTVWGLLGVGAAICFAVVSESALGWFALIMFVPFMIFFVGLVVSAEDAAEHVRHHSLIPAVAALSIGVLVLYLLQPSGGLDMPSIGSESDDPYSFE